MTEVRCAAYIRVSTDNQALRDEGSLETQEAEALVSRGFVQRTYRLGAKP